MQLALAIAMFLATIAHHYAYYVMVGQPARIFSSFGGLQDIVTCALVIYLLFKRFTDWRAAIIVIFAMFISLAESSMTFVCGWWYAFVYSGPALSGDKCELMSGLTISKPLVYTIAVLIVVIVPRIWSRTWGTLR